MIKVALALNNATPGEILSYRTQQAIKKYQKWALDTGSYAVKGNNLIVMKQRLFYLSE